MEGLPAVAAAVRSGDAGPGRGAGEACTALAHDGASAGDRGPREPGRIVQLEETVINRIAAGEVVVRPANALKELIENCLDAGSKHVVVALKAGGLKMLRIEDDGHGIRREDLPILCERFTTSKLRRYEDLNSIGTFGFRGEALASISHVAHVTVTTMTAQDSCAHVAQYTDGRLRAPPRPCAGTRGTTLVAEDLFHNNTTRRQALGKDSVEHARCLDVVQKYALHYPQVSFTCRKAAGTVADLHTAGGLASTARQVASLVHGSALAAQLFEFEACSEDPRFRCRGLASGPQWTSRSLTLTLFINNRLVECSSMRRAVEAVYAPVLPRHQHPWVYLALDLDPTTVDVNVHPTKSEVQFLCEEAISQKVQEVIFAKLKERAGVRTFDSQTSLLACAAPPPCREPPATTAPAVSAAVPAPYLGVGAAVPSAVFASLGAFAAGNPRPEEGGPVPIELDPPDDSLRDGVAAAAGTGLHPSAQPQVQAQTLPQAQPQQQQQQQQQQPKRVELNPTRIRTDHRQRSLESVWRDARAASQQSLEDPQEDSPPPPAPLPAPSPIAAGMGLAFGEDEASRQAAFEEAQQLTSIAELRAACARASDRELSTGLNQSVYVGPIGRELALLQCGATLCMVNLVVLAREFAYQRALRLFGGLGRIALREPLPLEAVLKLGIEDPASGYDPVAHAGVDVGALAKRFALLLEEKAEMLHEYLMLDISDGKLRSVPNTLGVTSEAGLKFDGLPLFLIRVCAETNWDEERPCLEGLCRLAADFSTASLTPSTEDAARCAAATAGAGVGAEAVNAAVEAGEYPDVAAAASALARKRRRTEVAGGALQELRYLHEAIRRDAAAAGAAAACQWPAPFKKDGTVVNLVSLEQLYRIFERC